MKYIITLVLLVPLVAHAQTQYALSAKDSKLNWQGNYPTGKGHEGTLKIRSGSLTLYPDGGVVASDFVLDMNSIHTTDISSENGAKDLDAHLKAEDFFHTAIYPTATFSFAKNHSLKLSAKPQMVKGYLTMKGLKHPLDFLAVINRQGKQVSVTATFSINRAKWNVKYKSRTFFNMLKDDIISDEIPVKLDLVFNSTAK